MRRSDADVACGEQQRGVVSLAETLRYTGVSSPDATVAIFTSNLMDSDHDTAFFTTGSRDET
jgi:hypothetical protein